jgi:hypothetical protein
VSRLFDVYCIVDWSANGTPKLGADSIWLSELVAGGEPTAVNVPTRHAAEHHLRDLIARHQGERVLIGVDFPLGYPAGFAAAAGLAGDPPWLAAWEHLAGALTDDDRNRNNRWQVAAELNARLPELRFWGCPPRHAGARLTTTRPPAPEARSVRLAEAALQSHTGRRPFTVWQLYGAGSVGSQVLTGIPVVYRLRRSERVAVWPFDTGFGPDPCAGRSDSVVIAEVWPSTVDPGGEWPKDRGQVLSLARHFAELDGAGGLAHAFAPTLTAAETQAAIDEEGWVLDARPTFRIHQEAHRPLES